MRAMTAARGQRPFAADLSRMCATFIAGEETPARKALLVLSNSEVHSVACYRFGRFAARVRRRSRFAGLMFTVAHRLWNRWVTHLHHCDISSHAEIGPGLLLMHRTGVIIGPATIGKNAVIHQNVTIGQRVAGGAHGLPRIGDNVWIGPGAIIAGAISIGDGATISAGTVLSRDVPPHALVAGVPGRVVTQDYDNRLMLGAVVH
ncbi:serine O-acetyltransferase [Microbacterium paludicola]|uniref:serine O-acetyltransferase n=1 Tax=Microbacterium paludicola TaxID=300019 RepID=UPI001C92F3DB|nr:DapH/DapD/GlmU-related protein [Microbacterium paludicola]